MNCKPGDLAIITAIEMDLRFPKKPGDLVKLGSCSPFFKAAWMLKPPCIDPETGVEVHLPDSFLKPFVGTGS